MAILRSHGELGEELLEASVNPKFGSTLARRLNQSCFPAVLQSNQITIKFGTAEARRLNWALANLRFLSFYKGEACQSILIMLGGKIGLSKPELEVNKDRLCVKLSIRPGSNVEIHMCRT